jgi:hypothetical protein
MGSCSETVSQSLKAGRVIAELFMNLPFERRHERLQKRGIPMERHERHSLQPEPSAVLHM